MVNTSDYLGKQHGPVRNPFHSVSHMYVIHEIWSRVPFPTAVANGTATTCRVDSHS